MSWNLYENGKFLEPLKFSNRKTQEDVVNEVLNSITNGEKIIFIHGVCGTGKCLEKNSLIFCKPDGESYFGYYKISELAGKKGEIFSLDETGKLVISKFYNVRKTGLKKIYSLKTRTGREISASKNHPFMTITKEGIKWTPLEKLNEKNYICLPNKINFEKYLNFDENKIKVLAHLISEGKLGDKAGSPKYYQDRDINPKIRKDYEKALRKLFPDGKIKNNHQTEVKINFNNMNTRFGTTNKLRLFIREFGLDGKKSKDKFVPKIIFNLNEKQISLFLRTLFSGDGCIYSRKSAEKNETFIIEYSSISRRLIQDVSLLLNRIGIQHTLTSKKFRENLDYCYRITISNQNQVKKFIELVGFIGEKQESALKILPKLKEHKFTNIDKVPRIIREYLRNKGYNYTELDRFLNYEEIENLRTEIGFKKIRKNPLIKTPFVFNQQKIDLLRSHINKINEYIQDKTLSFICNKDIVWDRIKIIKYVKEDETYDLEVEKNHNFIANGIIAHNSAIALNLAKEIGKSSIVVPIKNLQMQYKKDYENNKYLLKSNNEKLKISVITGRQNHKCRFLEEQEIPKTKKEINSTLNKIFYGKKNEDEISDDISADNKFLPCKIEIKERNVQKIKKYITQNSDVNIKNFSQLKDVKRASVAGACPYWSPALPARYELGGKSFVNSKKRRYMGLKNTEFIFYQREPGCRFYEQFNYYIDSDAIIFNSEKYKIESALNRKPLTEVEIIDECDEFLDKFSNKRSINLDRLQNSLNNLFYADESDRMIVEEIGEITKKLKMSKATENAIKNEEILPIKQTAIYDLFRILLKNENFVYNIDDENYLFEVYETAEMFKEFFSESYITFTKKDEVITAYVVTINLAKKFKELADKNKIIVLMSGTLHSEEVLKDIFGIDNFKIIEAETEQQGQITIKRTGLEMDCKYSNFSTGKNSLKDYFLALDKCLEIAKKPILVHVNSFADLPSEIEKENLNLKNLISREKLREIQDEDSEGKLIEEFKTGKIDILFSTRASRGIDFPGEQCNSIIFTKYPNPNVQDVFWKILNKTKPQHYWKFYRDKARRDLLQKIYRGLRFKDDHIFLLSPDTRVLEAFERK